MSLMIAGVIQNRKSKTILYSIFTFILPAVLQNTIWIACNLRIPLANLLEGTANYSLQVTLKENHCLHLTDSTIF